MAFIPPLERRGARRGAPVATRPWCGDAGVAGSPPEPQRDHLVATSSGATSGHGKSSPQLRATDREMPWHQSIKQAKCHLDRVDKVGSSQSEDSDRSYVFNCSVLIGLRRLKGWNWGPLQIHAKGGAASLEVEAPWSSLPLTVSHSPPFELHPNGVPDALDSS